MGTRGQRGGLLGSWPRLGQRLGPPALDLAMDAPRAGGRAAWRQDHGARGKGRERAEELGGVFGAQRWQASDLSRARRGEPKQPKFQIRFAVIIC